MIFVTMLNAVPGKSPDLVKLAKHPSIPPEVKIMQILGMFGKPDILIIFDAPSDRIAAEFAIQFSSCASTTTSLAMPVDNLKWTQI